MSVHKRKNRSGKTIWYYQFSLPGATRKQRNRVFEYGFATRGEAKDAEAARRIEEQQKRELVKAGSNVPADVPKTLAALFDEFFRRHVDEKLAPKTVERYHEQAAYLDQELLAMPFLDIKPLHLNREWDRLLNCGGHTRKTKASRPMSAKTVRNIAGMVSSAFSRAIKWGLAVTNPVTNSEPPRGQRNLAIALAPSQQDMVLESSS
jgi:hypothetical protein